MKLHTKWKRVYSPIIGVRFFDTGVLGLGYFTIEKFWFCKTYSKVAENLNGSYWFDEIMMKVRTDRGLVYKMPFIPWAQVYDESGKKSFGDYYNEDNFLTRKKSKR